MILKMVRTDKDQTTHTELIEAGQVHCTRRTFEKREDAEKCERGMGPHSVFKSLEMIDDAFFPVHAYLLSVQKRGQSQGSWELIVTYDTGIYLMNEQGKTIEIFSN